MKATGRDIGRQALERSLLGLGIILLAAWGLVQAIVHLDRERQFRALESEIAREAGGFSAPEIPQSVERYDVIGKIDVSDLDLAAVIREGVDRTSLLLAVGHVPGTPLPGARGNAVLAGHRDTFFGPLARARVGDVIRIRTPYGAFAYEIVSTEVVDPGRTDLLRPDRIQGITLVTCFPFRYVGRAPKRFVVTARQIDPPSTGSLSHVGEARAAVAPP